MSGRNLDRSTSTPPTGATSRRRPPRGGLPIPRPLAVVDYLRGGVQPDRIVAGNFTGDGHLDLAVANSGDNTVSVLLGNGHGTFQPQVTYAVGSYPYAIATGDFNGDGHTDLAVATEGDNVISVLLGNGNGTFRPQITSSVGISPNTV